jgi:hypothetical protein
MTENLSEWTLAIIGFRVNPHLCRDVVATAILRHDPRELLLVAMLLGDSVEMVMEHYSHLTQQNAIERSSAVISRILGVEENGHPGDDLDVPTWENSGLLTFPRKRNNDVRRNA